MILSLHPGVLLVRVTEWSRQLWREVWACNKYDDVFFYEQSALIRRLRARREGLELLPSGVPFHRLISSRYLQKKSVIDYVNIEKRLYQCNNLLLLITTNSYQPHQFIQPIHPSILNHSYLPGAYKGPKLFAHVAVLPHLELNTNSGWVQIQDSRVVHSQRRRIEKAKR